MEQMQIADYIITPDEHDLDADSLFVAIREWKPGIRHLLLEDYRAACEKENGRAGMFYQLVRRRLGGIDYASGGLHVYQSLGCVVIDRSGLDQKKLLWSKVAKDVARMIRTGRWIGKIEAKAEKAAAEKLKAEACRPAWNLGGKENES